VVAASAVAGYICAPSKFDHVVATKSAHHTANRSARRSRANHQRFPEAVRGRALFMDRDNLNTDGIYAGKWTYKDDMKPTRWLRSSFENYDPNFKSLAARRRHHRRRKKLRHGQLARAGGHGAEIFRHPS
jgi:homoaconitate hydratase